MLKHVFFADIEEALLSAQSARQVDWTLMLTHHLLKNLSVNQTYVVDNHYSTKCHMWKPETYGRFGDTSIDGLIFLYWF